MNFTYWITVMAIFEFLPPKMIPQRKDFQQHVVARQNRNRECMQKSTVALLQQIAESRRSLVGDLKKAYSDDKSEKLLADHLPKRVTQCGSSVEENRILA